MIRELHPIDFPRILRMGKGGFENRVYARSELDSSTSRRISLVMDSARAMGLSDGYSSLAKSDGSYISALTIAKRLYGPSSWEISRLHATTDPTDDLSDIINALFEAVRAQGGNQLSARVLAGDQTGTHLRRAGIHLAHNETLYQGHGTDTLEDALLSLRPKRKEDDHGVFLLYSAATPPEVRALTGMTMDQWMDSKWIVRNRSCEVSEHVLFSETQIVGWLQIVRRHSADDITIMTHPKRDGHEASILLNAGLSMVQIGKPVNLLVPEHQIDVLSAAERSDLKVSAEFEFHIRVTRVTEKLFDEIGAYQVVSS